MKKQYKDFCILLMVVSFFNIQKNICNPSCSKKISKKIILIGVGGKKGKT